MTQAATRYSQYEVDYETFRDQVANGPVWLGELRQRGFEAFESLRFPTTRKGNERWKYTNVNPIANGTFSYAFDVDEPSVSEKTLKATLPWHDSWSRLVFVDGRYAEGLSRTTASDNALQASNLSTTFSNDGELAKGLLAQQATIEDDGFTAVNTAFIHDGAVVTVADEAAAVPTLHLVYVTTERDEAIVTHPRTLVHVGRNSSLTVVESYVGLAGSSYFTNAVTEIVAQDGASVDHYRYMKESPEAFHIGNTKVVLDRDASFRTTSFATGAKVARNDLHVELNAPGASCVLNGLYATSGSEHIDNHINIDHIEPHTSSQQYFKGILDDNSRAVFSGRVVVHRDAQKSYATQADKNLLLSEGARINTKPSLEIYADDVQCTHGATAGAVAEEAVFYMGSRGIDPDTARRLLIYGFAREIIDTVKLEPLQRHLDGLFHGSLA